MYSDFDGKQDPHDLALKIADAGLPSASMMVRTPSNGIHGWWFYTAAYTEKQSGFMKAYKPAWQWNWVLI